MGSLSAPILGAVPGNDSPAGEPCGGEQNAMKSVENDIKCEMQASGGESAGSGGGRAPLAASAAAATAAAAPAAADAPRAGGFAAAAAAAAEGPPAAEVLCVTVREARNLVAKDFETSSSDP